MKTGGPAFPVFNINAECAGMTLRDYFAAKAMQAKMQCFPDVAAMRKALKDEGLTVGQYIADQAYIIADAMLEARDK